MALPETVGATIVVIEDENQNTQRVLRYPIEFSDHYRDRVWPVPLYNPYNDVVGEPKTLFEGNVWFDNSGVIAMTGIPMPLRTSDDARRLAVALLAAADAKDEIDNPRKIETDVKY